MRYIQRIAFIRCLRPHWIIRNCWIENERNNEITQHEIFSLVNNYFWVRQSHFISRLNIWINKINRRGGEYYSNSKGNVGGNAKILKVLSKNLHFPNWNKVTAVITPNDDSWRVTETLTQSFPLFYWKCVFSFIPRAYFLR